MEKEKGRRLINIFVNDTSLPSPSISCSIVQILESPRSIPYMVTTSYEIPWLLLLKSFYGQGKTKAGSTGMVEVILKRNGLNQPLSLGTYSTAILVFTGCHGLHRFTSLQESIWFRSIGGHKMATSDSDPYNKSAWWVGCYGMSTSVTMTTPPSYFWSTLISSKSSYLQSPFLI